MAVRTYRLWSLDLCPPWLHGTWGKKLIEGIGVMFDEAYNNAFEAGAAGSVDAPTFPVDALALVGSERSIERYPAETNDQYRVRVKGAWESWAQAGTMRLVAELEYLGFDAEIKENHTAGWDWDGDADNWSRIWIVITGHSWEPTVWGQSGRTWKQNNVWGCDATYDEAATLLRLIRKWKPGHVLPITIVVMDEGDFTEPDGTWDDPAERSDAALYHFER
jgi:hypothetical protein